VTRVRISRIFWIGAAGALVLAAPLDISSLPRSDSEPGSWSSPGGGARCVRRVDCRSLERERRQLAGSRFTWIVALVGWLDMPVLQRFAASATSTAPVLATLDDVELVASRANGLAIELAPGEHLALRRRPRA